MKSSFLLSLALMITVSVPPSSSQTRRTYVWVSPQNCPFKVTVDSENLLLQNTTTGHIISYRLGCAKTTKAGLAEVSVASEMSVQEEIAPGITAFSGKTIFRKLERDCLKHSAAAAPVEVTFKGGEKWRLTDTQ